MAIVLPLLAFLALLVTEGADFVRVHTVLNNAAREGARLSAQPENQGQTAGIVTAVQKYVTDESRGRVQGSDAIVTVVQNLQVSTDNGSGPVMMSASRVTVTYSYTFVYLPNFMTSSLPLTLQAQSEFRNLY
jgi:Flp pilus assembly protein TadG